MSHQKFCKMHPVLTGHAIQRTTNHIRSEKELITSASYKVNNDDVEMGEVQSWEAEYKHSAYKSKEINESLQGSSQSRDFEESRGSDSRRCDIDETIRMWQWSYVCLRRSSYKRSC